MVGSFASYHALVLFFSARNALTNLEVARERLQEV
jgi:hypothetical protein